MIKVSYCGDLVALIKPFLMRTKTGLEGKDVVVFLSLDEERYIKKIGKRGDRKKIFLDIEDEYKDEVYNFRVRISLHDFYGFMEYSQIVFSSMKGYIETSDIYLSDLVRVLRK